MDNNKNKILEIAALFQRFNIYPQAHFSKYSPVRVFKETHKNNHYSKEIELILKNQNNKITRKTADLPWWGKCFFTSDQNHHKRIMIIAQDSLSRCEGSIVFHAHVMPLMDVYKYKNYVTEHGLSPFVGWGGVHKFITELIADNPLNMDYFYITDAQKVYCEIKSGNPNEFDKPKSRDLLHGEIDICKPDLIIALGKQALSILIDEPSGKIKLGEYVKNPGIAIFKDEIKYVVSYFPVGRGIAYFTKNKDLIMSNIKNAINAI